MLDHIVISVADYDASKKFYLDALAPLGYAVSMEFGRAGGFGVDGKPDFWIKEGDALVKVGYAYVSLGDVDKGIALIEQGIAKGGLKRPDEARLRLGTAQLQSATAKGTATPTLRSVKANDGSADIARLWLLMGNS